MAGRGQRRTALGYELAPKPTRGGAELSYAVEDLEAMAKKIQYDLTAAKTKLSELQRGIAAMATKLPPTKPAPVCPQCQLEVRGKTLTEHLEDVHGIRAA